MYPSLAKVKNICTDKLIEMHILAKQCIAMFGELLNRNKRGYMCPLCGESLKYPITKTFLSTCPQTYIFMIIIVFPDSSILYL